MNDREEEEVYRANKSESDVGKEKSEIWLIVFLVDY
jgi:hypothetical protein